MGFNTNILNYNVDENLRIMIYSDHFFPSIGGSENYALDLANGLISTGHTVGVITSEQTEFEDPFKFQMFRLQKPISIMRANVNFFQIASIIKTFKPDIFHINYQTGTENLLILILRLLRIPIILTYHADHIRPIGRIIDKLQMLFTFRLINLILVQTGRDLANFESFKFFKLKVMKLNFNGVDTDRFSCSNVIKERRPNFTILSVMRIDKSHLYKGIDNLINLFDKAHLEGKVRKPLVLNIVGGGDLLPEYREMIEKRTIKNIHLLGHLNENDYISAICNSNAMILLSNNKAEGFGRVVLEAISCKIPTIVSRYSGISEIIDRYKSGIVLDVLDENSLCDAIDKLLTDKNFVKDLDRNMSIMIRDEKLSLKDVVKEHVKIYRNLINSLKEFKANKGNNN